MKKIKLHLSALLIVLVSPAALAGAIDTMNEYNLIVFDDLTSNSEVEGKTVVMGDLNGSASNYGTHLPSASTSGSSLIIGGDNNSTLNINNGHGVAIGGDNNGTINLNGGGTQTNNTDSYDLAAMKTELTDFSTSLANLSANSTLDAPVVCCGAASFEVGNLIGNDVAIFDIQASDLFENTAIQQFDIDFNSQTPSAVIINVGGTTITDALFSANAVGNMVSEAFQSIAIWNFYEATTINLSKQFNGSLLAPLATLTNSTAIEGSVVVDTFIQLGEVHDSTFSGDIDLGNDVSVPEPTTLAFLPLFLFGLIRLRKNKLLSLYRSSVISFNQTKNLNMLKC